MRIILLLVVQIWVVGAVSGQTTPVEFRVNMNHFIEEERFDPSTEFVDLAGSFNDWGNPGSQFNDNDKDGIYTITEYLSVGTTIEFKARINGEWNGREEFPGGGPNRSFTIVENGIIEFWYNDEVPDNILNVRISSSGSNISPEESINFIDQSSGNPVTWEWVFPGGSPAFSDQQNPVVTYFGEGKYDVTLTISNLDGETLSKTFANYVSVGKKETYWWNETIFYEIFVRSFKDSDGDGRGDFKGLIEKLDYLNDGDPRTHHDLGITGIWLMPVQQSPSYHGYDVTNYREIERDYGTNEDFKLFMEEAHKRGIKVIIDLVLNHSSDEISWFEASTEPDSDYRDWYIWRDTNPGGTGPWGQQVWHNRNGDYYYGLFWGGMPDLNYNTPEVKTEMFDIARFWLEEMDVDGFRLDAVKYIFETESSLEDTEETFQFWKDFRTHYKSIKSNSFSVGEAWTSTDKVVKYVEGDGLDYCFEFDLANAVLNAVNSGTSSGLYDQTENVMSAYPYLQFGTFLTNHDINRVMDQFGADESKARLASQLLLSLPGIPYLYYGEEIGMTGSKPDEDIRTPMQWDSGEGAGFTEGSPWHRINSDYVTKNVALQQKDYNSIWASYRDFIAIRMNQTAIQKGNYRSVNSSEESVFAFLRQYEDENILVVANLSQEENQSVLSMSFGGIDEGKYDMVELMGRDSDAITIDNNGGFTDVQIDQIPARTTFIYKFFQGEPTETQVNFLVDMNGLIKANAFDPATESVDIVAGFNGFGSDETTLSDPDHDGIYSYTFDKSSIGQTIAYKYRINGQEDGRAEFPNQDFLREYLVLEGENIVLDVYQSDLLTHVDQTSTFTVYPNPNKGKFYVELQEIGSEYSIVNMAGVELKKGEIKRGQLLETGLPSGLYILKIKSGQQVVTKRILIH